MIIVAFVLCALAANRMRHESDGDDDDNVDDDDDNVNDDDDNVNGDDNKEDDAAQSAT